MRRDTVVSARKHARIGRNSRAYYTALGKMALENMRTTLGWCMNALRLPVDRNQRDAVRDPHEH